MATEKTQLADALFEVGGAQQSDIDAIGLRVEDLERVDLTGLSQSVADLTDQVQGKASQAALSQVDQNAVLATEKAIAAEVANQQQDSEIEDIKASISGLEQSIAGVNTQLSSLQSVIAQFISSQEEDMSTFELQDQAFLDDLRNVMTTPNLGDYSELAGIKDGDILLVSSPSSATSTPVMLEQHVFRVKNASSSLLTHMYGVTHSQDAPGSGDTPYSMVHQWCHQQGSDQAPITIFPAILPANPMLPGMGHSYRWP